MDVDATIMVVDDDPLIREMLEDYLCQQGFGVALASSGNEMRETIDAVQPNLVLLDLNLGGEDGLSLARFVRQEFDMGIIMVTASDEVVDRVVGLEVGADDYVTKPFELRELLARIRSVLRRTAAFGAKSNAATPSNSCETETPAQSSRIAFGDCILDLDSQRLTDGKGEEVTITAMEFDLLRVFSEHPNKVLSRDQILNQTQHRDWDPYDRSVDIRIARLRKKLETDPATPKIIKTVRGSGYIFVSEN